MPDRAGSPPWVALRASLEAEASAREARGDSAGATALRAAVSGWWTAQCAWNTRVAEVLAAHHEINNALVGVRGNAQLLLMNPEGQQQGVRERLEVVLRESSRIQEAAARLRELKTSLGGGDPGQQAA